MRYTARHDARSGAGLAYARGMATVHILRGRDTLRLTLSGPRLITGEGDTAIVQAFPSEEAARSHLEMVLSRRKRSGYTIETQELSEEPALPDPLVGCVEWDATRRNMRVTFKGSEIPAGRCEQIVARAAENKPLCLHIICDHASPGASLSVALAGVRLPSIRSFIFDTYFQTVTRQANNSPGDLAAVLEAMPELEAAFVTGDVLLRPLAHAKLRALFLLADPLALRTLAGLGDSQLPALTTLGLTVASDGEPPSEKAIAAALLKVGAGKLNRIDIDGLGDVVALLTALSTAALPASWATLRLDGSISDEDALLGLLGKRKAAFARLTALVMPLADEVSETAAEQGARLVPALKDCDELAGLLMPTTYAKW